MDQYCYWEIKTTIDFYCGELLTICSTIFAVYIIYHTYKLFKIHKTIDFKVKIIYIHLSIWALFHIAKLLMGQIVFAVFFQNNQKIVEEKGSKFYQVFCVVDSLSTIVLQGILLLIPYIWTTNITAFLEFGAGKILKKTKIFFSLILGYLWVRFPIYAAIFVLQLLNYDTFNCWCEIINYYILTEALLCVVLLVFSLKLLLQNFDLLNLNTDRDEIILKRQISLLMIFCFLRLCINVVFIVLENFIDWEKNDDKCVNPPLTPTTYINTVFYLVIGIIVTHYFPVVMVLRIYNIKTKKSLLENSSITVSYE